MTKVTEFDLIGAAVAILGTVAVIALLCWGCRYPDTRQRTATIVRDAQEALLPPRLQRTDEAHATNDLEG